MPPAADTPAVIERLRAALETDPRIAYALVFGSHATGKAHGGSDLDVALGFADGRRVDAWELGALTARLESATGCTVDLVLLDEAPPGLAFRVFRDGRAVVVRDRGALSRRRARAILDYLDFRPMGQLFTRGVLLARP